MFIVTAYTLRCIYVHSNSIHIEVYLCSLSQHTYWGAFMFKVTAYTLRYIYVHSNSIHIEVYLCSQ